MNSAATTSSGRRRRKNQYVSVNLRSPSEGEDSPDRSTTIGDDEDDEDEEEEKAGNDTGGESEGSCDESFDDEYSCDDETITIPPLPSQSQSQSQSQSRLNPIHIPCQIPGRERADYYAETSAIRDDMDENNININIINNNNNNNNNNIFNDIDNNVIETGNRIGTNSSNHHHQRIIHNHNRNRNHNHNSNNTGAMEIDPDAVRELTDDLHDLRVNLMFLLLIFAVMAGGLALNDLYYLRRPGANTTTKTASTDGNGHGNAIREDGTGMGNNNSNSNSNSNNRPPFPHRGHKIQINASAFTANDFECLQLDTGNWPSERVHCELLPNDGSDDDNHNNNNNYNYNYNNNNDDDVARYSFVVEHFDDDACTVPNAQNPVVRHTASGCYYYETYNHSYHDLCHPNRTLTVSAFEGPGCLLPLPVTATNLLPED